MIGGKGLNQQKPTALGSMLQASTYGLTIPEIFGLTKSPLLAIWAANLRAGGGSSKKFKQKKKGQPAYVENIDFLLGQNPIAGVFQAWQNTTKYPLNFVSLTGLTPNRTYTITDPYFYAVVAVTWVSSYSATFDDFGAQGPQTVSGSFEIPLWNEAHNGPDPTNSSGYRFYPYVYKWAIADDNVVTFPVSGLGDVPPGVTSANIYYAQLSAAIKHWTPLAMLRLTFEPVLADGPEYAGNLQGTSTPLSSQQQLKPWCAGVGSPNFDLGSGGMIPDTRVEVMGAHSIYSTGDADFADMIEDIVKSGVSEAGINAADGAPGQQGVSPVQHGAGLFDYPGCVQKKFLTYETDLANPTERAFSLPNTKGNILLCWWSGGTTGTITGVTSDSGETWHNIDVGGAGPGGAGWVFAYAISNGYGAGNRVYPQMGGDYGSSNVFLIAELAGVDSFDSAAAANLSGVHSTAGVALTTGNARGFPAVVFGFMVNPGNLSPALDPRWNVFMVPWYIAMGQWRTLWAPATVSLKNVWTGLGESPRVILASFKATVPPAYPRPALNIIDDATMNLARQAARAGGLWGSLTMDSQKECSAWLKDLYSSMNAAPVYLGDKLQSIPYAEASAVGNGAIYISPTAAGPVASLSTQDGSILGDGTNPPVKVSRKPPPGEKGMDRPSILQYTIPNRTSDYNPVTVLEPDAAGTAMYGSRLEAPEEHDEVQSVAVARTLLAIRVLRRQYVEPVSYEWSSPSGQKLLSPMDLITLTDPLAQINQVPVRITSAEEATDDKGRVTKMNFTAEPFVYGASSPNVLAATPPAPNQPNTMQDPGPVSTPIIFEPVPRLAQSPTTPELWIVVSSSSAIYGGCIVLISTDGGNSYNPAGQISGNGITGVSTADWPAASDPDTANDLPLDLTESLGVLASYAAADRDNFTYPCYIAGGNASIPYGLLAYNTALLTATNKYTLKAAGSGNELRRCVFGAPVAAPGPDVDHPSGSRFAFLGNPAQLQQPGILRLTMDPKWIGTTLYFKFLSLNSFGNAIEGQSDVSPYTFTPTGIPGGGIAQNQQYTQTPAVALSQPSGTQISMAAVLTQFQTNAVTYNARNFTIANPSAPTAYYVTIADPGQVGDTGSGTNLTATCQTSNALVGVPGNTFIGFIIAVPGGGSGAIAGPGGWPEPQGAIVTS